MLMILFRERILQGIPDVWDLLKPLWWNCNILSQEFLTSEMYCELLDTELFKAFCFNMQRHQTCAQVLHKNRTGNVFDGYDIALLLLNGSSSKTPIQFSKGVQLREGTRMTTMGFAGIDGERLAFELQKIDNLKYIPNHKCAEGLQLSLTETMLCGFAGRAGPCKGTIPALTF